MANEKYIIECRKDDGTLDFSGVQPEQVFGHGAIGGMTDDEMAKVVFRKCPDLKDGAMHGRNIALWPSFVDSRFVARRKT
jgi:hypothetical protein